jgi:putative NIF3 family GTP cyclohydrolase 1 type 2
MFKEITALQIIDRIKNQPGKIWKDSTVDVFNAGNTDTPVTGIVTTFAPTIEVLRRSVAGGKNLIISRQPAFYRENRSVTGPGGGSRQVTDFLKDDPTYLYKQEFIDKNKLIIWRFYENWNAKEVDGQLMGLAKSLGWDEYHIHDVNAGGEPYDKKNRYFLIPESTLNEVVARIQDKLNIKGIRVIGDPGTRIKKASLSHGMFRVPDLQEILKEPDIDLVVIGEPVEWEASPYFQDIIAWEKKKGMIILGQEVTEEPGSGEVALWLKTFIPEIPIEWIPAGEPFWIP